VRRRTTIEVRRAQVAKTLRTAIRLKHSLAADEEINEVLPTVLADLDRAVQQGLPWELSLGKVLDEA
jgi:hypothetical protein